MTIMVTSLARDLLRIVAFVPYRTANISRVVDRAWWWADEVFARDFPESVVQAVLYPDVEAHRLGPSVDEAWLAFEEETKLREGDYVAVLSPDEVVVDSQAIRKAVRQNLGKVLGATMVRMQDDVRYDVDHYEAKHVHYPFFPYKQHGRFVSVHNPQRGPSYVKDIDRVETPVATILNYADVALASKGRKNVAVWTGGGTL